MKLSRQLLEAARSREIRKKFGSVDVVADVYTDGSGMSITMDIPIRGQGMFKVGGSVGDVTKDPAFQLIKGRRGVANTVTRAVFDQARSVFKKLVGEQSAEWLKMNKEMYA